jgi:hypothetical protein
MAEQDGMHVKVTINDLYKEQQETNKLLIQLAAQLNNLSDIPDRMRAVEKYQDSNSWVPKLVWAALIAGLSGFVTALYLMIVGS